MNTQNIQTFSHSIFSLLKPAFTHLLCAIIAMALLPVASAISCEIQQEGTTSKTNADSDSASDKKTHAQAATSLLNNKGQCGETINVDVNGLVCDFCARALEKVVGKRDDVKDIAVDLTQGKVSIHMQRGKTLDDATVTQLITHSGYNVVNINKGC